MRLVLGVFLSAFLAFSFVTTSLQGEEQNVFSSALRIRLAAGQKEFVLSGKNVHWLGVVSPLQFVSIPRDKSYKIRFENGKWIVESSDGIKQVFTQKILALKGDDLTMKYQRLPSRVFFWQEDGKIDLVAVLDMNEYLQGVVASEMSASWPIEALKAQAVVSRSYALHQVEKNPKRHFHLDATVRDQVFEGLALDLSRSQRERVEKAVKETEGLVLFQRGGNILKAYFHADCGGQTEDASLVWSMRGKSASVKDEACPLNPRARWSYKTSILEFAQLVSGEKKKVESFKVIQRSPSQRVEIFRIVYKDQTQEDWTGEELREKVGYNRLRSTNFQIATTAQEIEFTGLGWGHGVGMCQWGAKHLAQTGQAYQKILEHYYPNAKMSLLPQYKESEKIALGSSSLVL